MEAQQAKTNIVMLVSRLLTVNSMFIGTFKLFFLFIEVTMSQYDMIYIFDENLKSFHKIYNSKFIKITRK